MPLLQPPFLISLRSLLQNWSAPLFAAILSAIIIGTSFQITPHSYEPILGTFFCFLPMAFFFGAAAQLQSQKQIRDLELRIEVLEAQAK